MQRITQHAADKTAVINKESLVQGEDGSFSGEAAEALAKYEDALELIVRQYKDTCDKIEKLKSGGRRSTSTAQQLVAQKLTYASILAAMGHSDETLQ